MDKNIINVPEKKLMLTFQVHSFKLSCKKTDVNSIQSMLLLNVAI